jgi:hypothetical protein
MSNKLPPHLRSVPTPLSAIARRKPVEPAPLAKEAPEAAESEDAEDAPKVEAATALTQEVATVAADQASRLQAVVKAGGIVPPPPGLQLPPGLPAPVSATAAAAVQPQWFTPAKPQPTPATPLLATPGTSPLLSTSPKPAKHGYAKAIQQTASQSTTVTAKTTCEMATQTEDVVACPHCHNDFSYSAAAASCVDERRAADGR